MKEAGLCGQKGAAGSCCPHDGSQHRLRILLDAACGWQWHGPATRGWQRQERLFEGSWTLCHQDQKGIESMALHCKINKRLSDSVL